MTGGDAPITEISSDAFDRIIAVNLRGIVLTCKHALPLMRAQGSGVIITISSIAAIEGNFPWVTYKASKAALVTLTQQLAIQKSGVRYSCERHTSWINGYTNGCRQPSPSLGSIT
ncbi:MAG: hypothetical protein CM1200mP18_08620 [Gammaproteobacteria bacterium]|nr:MAG: hypothetical protein CM1200mP18_08620 [Gammaproteobacteria bacterium]